MTGSRALQGASCLVLGAGGFIGGHLCHGLVEAGAAVAGFGHRPFFPDSVPPIRFVAGEFGDRGALARAVAGMDFVFHLLGGTNPEASNRDPIADLQANTLASVQLVEVCRDAAIRKLVFMSSGGTVYGVPAATPIPEAAPTDPICAYGIGKLAVEKYLQLYARLGGAAAVSLRVANPFGPFQNALRRQGVVCAVVEALLDNRAIEVWGDGSVVRDYIYVEDLVDAILAAATYDGPHPVFNIGSGVGRSVLDVVTAVSAILERTPLVRFNPNRPADVPVNVLDITRARDALGWRPKTAWEDGLRRTVDWARSRRDQAR